MQSIIEFIIEAHKGQTRKNEIDQTNLPYVCHPLEVMSMVWRWGCAKDPSILAAAALHDVLEDCDVTTEQIEEIAGTVVSLTVQNLTFTCYDKPGTESYKIAKQQYIESFRDKDLYSLVIKLADRICNIRDFRAQNPKYAIKYIEKSRPLFQIFADRSLEIQRQFGSVAFLNVRSDVQSICSS